MSQPLVYVDTSEVQPGKLTQLKAAIEELAEFVEENEPELISYSVYFDESGSRMSVVHVHADSASLDYHMDVAGPLFPKVLGPRDVDVDSPLRSAERHRARAAPRETPHPRSGRRDRARTTRRLRTRHYSDVSGGGGNRTRVSCPPQAVLTYLSL